MRSTVLIFTFLVALQSLMPLVSSFEDGMSLRYSGPLSEDVIGPILISNDDDFDDEALARGWPGNGSEGNPYVIEDLQIDANMSGYGLAITSTLHYLIRNCTVWNATGGGSPVGGIYLLGGNGTITGCQINDSGYGILSLSSGDVINNTVFDCHNGIWVISDGVQVENNTIFRGKNHALHYQGDGSILRGNSVSDFDFGIYLKDSDRNRLEGNSMTDIDDHGIRLDSSENNVIISNYARNNDDGVYLGYRSNNNIVINNTVALCEEGIYISSGNNNSCFGNMMYNCSFRLGFLEDTFISQTLSDNNTANGLPVRYLVSGEMDNSSFSEPSGQILLFNAFNTTIEGIHIGNGTVGMVIQGCEKVIISNCILSDHIYQGIHILDSEDVEIDSIVVEACEEGVSIDNCLETTVRYSMVEGNTVGVISHRSRNTSFSDLAVSSSSRGIVIWYDCTGSIVKDCSMSNSLDFGLEVRSAGSIVVSNTLSNDIINTASGVYVNARDCLIKGNSISGFHHGSRMEFTVNCRIVGNVINDCLKGIDIFRSDGDLILSNSISSDEMIFGIGTDNAIGLLISDNSIRGDGDPGIYLTSSEEIRIYGNTLDHAYIDISISQYHEDPDYFISQNNTVDGLPVLYYNVVDLKGVVIPNGMGQYIFFRCRNGIVKDIEQSPHSLGMLALLSNKMVFSNLSFSGKGMGIYLASCSNIQITGSRFSSLDTGILTYEATETRVFDCNFNDISGSGVEFTSSFGESVVGSSFNDCDVGVKLSSANSPEVWMSLFTECRSGIWLGKITKGAVIRDSGFLENLGYGVNFNYSFNNRVMDCAFVNNGRYLPEPGHIWSELKDIDLQDNYFADHLSPDDDSDGFVDDPYIISFNDFDLIERSPRSYLPARILGSPVNFTSEQFLFENIITWDSPTFSLIGTEITGYIVRRLRGPGVEPFSWYVQDGTMIMDREVGNGTETIYTIQAVSTIGEGAPVYLSSTLNKTRPHVAFNLADNSTLDSVYVDLSYQTTVHPDDIISVVILIDGEMVTPGVGEDGFIFNSHTDGYHEAEIIIRDTRGFNASDRIGFLVDTIGPSISLYTKRLWVNSSMDIQYNSSDKNTIERIHYIVINDTDQDLYELEDMYTYPYSGDFSVMRSGAIHPTPEILQEGDLDGTQGVLILDLPEGNFTVIFEVFDDAGNRGSDIIHFGVDRTSPEVMDWMPKEDDADIGSDIELVISEEIVTILDQITDLGFWGNMGGGRYHFIHNEGLDYNKDYEIGFHGMDRAGNHISFIWSFKTAKDASWTTTVILHVIDQDGDPLDGVTVNIDNSLVRETGNNGWIIDPFNLGEGTYNLMIFKEGYINITREFNVTYGDGPLDLGQFTLMEEARKDGEKETPPYLLFFLGVMLIIITIYFAITAFTRKGGPLDEE